VDYVTPIETNYRYKPLIDTDIFGEVDKSKLRQKKPSNSTPPPSHKPTDEQLRKLRKLRPVESTTQKIDNELMQKLVPGAKVEHMRFGIGQIVNIEGNGQDKKAEIKFQQGGLKKLLLRFAKLKVLRTKS